MHLQVGFERAAREQQDEMNRLVHTQYTATSPPLDDSTIEPLPV